MKKYWKLITVFMVMIIGIGIFLVKSVESTATYPKLKINTLSGNEKEIAAVTLQGNITNKIGEYISAGEVKITTKGSDYWNDASYFDLFTYEYDDEIKDLKNRYRNFMRTKNSSIENFYEDEKYLAYVVDESDWNMNGQKKYQLKVSILNKKTDTIEDFMLDLTNPKEISYLDIRDVQMIAGKIYVMINADMFVEEKISAEQQLYTIDIAKRKVVNVETLFQNTNSEGNHQTHINIVNNWSMAKSEYVIFEKWNMMLSESAKEMTNETKEYYIYHYQTKELQPIKLPTDFALLPNLNAYTDDSNLLLISENPKGLDILTYHVETGQFAKPFQIPYGLDRGNSYKELHDGKLYFTFSSEQVDPLDVKLMVIDLKAQKEVYKGEVVLTDKDSTMGSKKLDLNGFNFK